MPDPRQFDLKIRPEICYFGVYDNRGNLVPFGIKRDDRRRHMYVLGKTGMGKTTFLENMAIQDIYNGEGVCFIDPHGDAAEYIMDRIPSYRQNDVIYFDPADTNFPIAFNILEQKTGEEKYLVASGMMAVFTKIWAGMWSTRMEYILNNCILALLDSPGNTLLGITRMLTDKGFRNKIVSKVSDPIVKTFWEKEFASFNDRYKQEAIAPIQNKIGQFLSSNLMRNIVGQPRSSIDMREIMDKRKILIINLSKGKIGEDNSALLGSLLITKLQLAAMSRVNMPEHERNDFYLYVDEFQNFTTDSFATILSEARKYRLNLILAHQYISQLTETGALRVKNAVFGNVGTIICFRIGADDAEALEREFAPVFTSQHLQNLNARQIVIKLSIDNAAAGPFLAETLPPVFEKMGGRLMTGLKVSRERYGVPVTKVENAIFRWLNNTNPNLDLNQIMDDEDGNTAPPAPNLPTQNQEDTSQSNPTSPVSDDPNAAPAPKKRRRRKKSNNAANTNPSTDQDQDSDNDTDENNQSSNQTNQPDSAPKKTNNPSAPTAFNPTNHDLMSRLNALKNKRPNTIQNSPEIPTSFTPANQGQIAPGIGTKFALGEFNSDENPFELP
ncbi:MAG: hypothetical protein OHK0017_05810 [Patescibacteria group bacterium]